MADKGPILTSIIIFYLSIGAAIFQFLEEPHLNAALEEYNNHTDYLLQKYPCLTKEDLNQIIKVVATAAGRGVTVTGEKQFKNWSWENAVVFAATVITTIGYGNVAPKTTYGRLFYILYGLCGIPLCLTWISELGTFFGSRAKSLSQVLLHKHLSVKKVQFICTIVFLLWGFLVHLIFPAFVFMRFENWTYLEGLYFSFTTLTTVGFGDYVAGVNPDMDYPNLYRFFVQLWICLGLAWLSLFFSWNVHMVVEAHKVLKKRRLRRHRLPIDDVPEEKEIKKAPKPPPLSGVIDIFEFMSEKVEDYSDIIQAIGADERRKKKKQEEELARSKSCSDLLRALVIPLDHSPRLKRRFSVSANMCMVTSGESTDGLNDNNNNNQEEQTLLKEHHKDSNDRKNVKKGTEKEEKPGCHAWESRKSDPSIYQSSVQSPTVTTSNRGSRFSVSKVSEDHLLEKRKSIG
ncbi:Potassium channel subfamily K member 5 [Labeo rohita]|uniref:Potassium channel subfamily K member 5 n=1 Tax=Labeo rohita TaxID=84645 RepID=A0ABQ8LM89_LABRO|nr:potassium channel subfamily K member 5b [Labeo rohita]KAI2651770.1 Potassium channel subfamily K member 5 [Labeo rohita]